MEAVHEDMAFVEWLAIVKGEYCEQPGLRLTKLQAQRLWGLDLETCNAVLDALEKARFLKRTAQNTYVRADGVCA
jgi:hypothetical protein